ncbi:Ig-like domain-containing protein [Pseudomonas sp. ZS1P83]
MTIQPFDQVPPSNDVLALYPPKLPDSNSSVDGAECGLAKEFYDLTPRGATVIVDPFVNQAPLDTVQLNLNGEMNIASTQTQSTDDSVVIYIPKNKLRSDPGYVNELTYTIIRGSNNEGTSEPPLTILYNAIRPGMEDKIEDDEGHSELELILPNDVIEDGIDAYRAAQGVQVYFSYPYCRAYDRILLNCNGHDVYREVHADEAPATPTSVPTRIGLLLDKTVLEGAGDHPEFSFSYTVSDQIGNGADLDSPWSAAIPVDVDLKGIRMAAPDITEDPDDPTDAPDTIDLNKLGSKDLTIQVHVLEPVWAADDTIRVKYTATPSAGGVVEHVVEAQVARLPFTHKLQVPNAKVIADSVVKVTYEQVRGGVISARSRIARALVIVKPVLTSVKNSFGAEIENGGTVSDNKVTLSGSALAGAVLQIFDGGTFIDDVQTGSDYKWQSRLIPIAVGQRRFMVKEKSGDQLESEPWLLERLAFTIEKQPMILKGYSVKIPQWPKTGVDSIGNTAVRTPTGGVPPYSYLSSEPLKAAVTENGGKVTGLKSGVSTIYVVDQEGTTLDYLVSVSNVYRLQISDELLTSPEAVSWMYSMQGAPIYTTFYWDVHGVYVPPSRTSAVWTCRPGSVWLPGGQFYQFNQTLKYPAWCVIPI